MFPNWTSEAISRAFIKPLKVTLQSSKLVCLENHHAHHLPYVGGGRWKSHKHIIYRIYLLKLLLLSVRCLLMCNPNKRFPTVIRTLKQYKSTTYLVKHITLYLLYKHSWLLTLLLSNWTTYHALIVQCCISKQMVSNCSNSQFTTELHVTNTRQMFVCSWTFDKLSKSSHKNSFTASI